MKGYGGRAARTSLRTATVRVVYRARADRYHDARVSSSRDNASSAFPAASRSATSIDVAHASSAPRSARARSGVAAAARTVAGVSEPLPRLDATALDAGPLKFAASPPVHPRFAPLVAKFAGRGAEAVPMGSAGLKAALVADGSAHMYPSSFAGMHAWDVAAGHALCRATGADLEALDGSTIAYAKDLVLSKGVLFAAPAVDADLKTKLRAMYAAIASRPRN